MKRRAAFGLPGVLALSVVFAGFVVSCPTEVDYIRPIANFNSGTIYLLAQSSPYPYDYRNTYTLVVTLRPRAVLYGARIEWSSDDDGIVFVKQDTKRPISGGFGENGRASVTIVGYHESAYATKIWATITLDDSFGEITPIYAKVNVRP